MKGRTTARRLIRAVIQEPWAIHPDWLLEFAAMAEEARARGDDLHADELRTRLRSALEGLGGGRPEALSVDSGDPVEGAHALTVRRGVAILPVSGPLYHRAHAFTDVCGCSAYDLIGRDLAIALDRADVGAVLLDVDSPGGEVAGMVELGQMIRESRAEKPVVSYVSDLGASAAYVLASAASEVVVAPTAILGSIGVVMTFVDRSEQDRKSGVRRFEMLASQGPRKRPDPDTDEGRAQIQEMLDELGAVMVAEIAESRGVSTQTVLSDFGQGGVLVGARSVDVGLADRVGSFESLLAELAEEAEASTRGAPAGGGIPLSEEDVMSTEQKTAAPADEKKTAAAPAPLTVATLERDHPDLAAALKKAGADAERARILGIEDLAPDPAAKLVREAKENPAATVEAFAVDLAKAAKAGAAASAERAQGHLRAVKDAEKELDAPAPSTEETASTEDRQVAALMAAVGQPQKKAS